MSNNQPTRMTTTKQRARDYWLKDMVDFCQLPTVPATMDGWVKMLCEYPEEVIKNSWLEIIESIKPRFWPEIGKARAILNRNRKQFNLEHRQIPKGEAGNEDDFLQWNGLMQQGLQKIKSGEWTREEFYLKADTLAKELGIPGESLS